MLAEAESAGGMRLKKLLSCSVIAILCLMMTQKGFAANEPVVPPAAAATSASSEQSFLEKYPHLKQNLAPEPNANLYLGLSVGALGVLNNRMLFSANFFQLHYMTEYWDSEILSISYGATTGSPSYVQSNHFIFRSIPKYRINKLLSVGPLFGYEFVSFPEVSAVISNDGFQSKPEPFSSAGLIYGLGFSENFSTDKGYQIKVNQVVYQQNYSTQDAGHGWRYLFDLRSLRTDPTPIKAGMLFLLEVGVLF